MVIVIWSSWGNDNVHMLVVIHTQRLSYELPSISSAVEGHRYQQLQGLYFLAGQGSHPLAQVHRTICLPRSLATSRVPSKLPRQAFCRT